MKNPSRECNDDFTGFQSPCLARLIFYLKFHFCEWSADSAILVGDVLAGIWQYMNEEWSSFREMVFDIILFVFVDRWEYIGYGYLLKVRPVPPPEPSSSSLNRNASLALNEIE